LLKDISLTIPEQEFVVILGKNGSGKSTLLKCIAGILYPEEAELYVLGKKAFDNRTALTKELGILFGQRSLLFTDLKAIDYLQLLKKIYGLSDHSFHERIHMVDQFLSCKHLLEKQVRGMSYGEKMKIELLSIILHTPKILILDEPFVGLDPSAQQNLLRFLQFYKEAYQVTILLTTHQFLDILTLADRAIVIEKGVITYNGSVDQLFDYYLKKKIIKVLFADPFIIPI
jgi:ABC-2 type transport system ATP-binding protein